MANYKIQNMCQPWMTFFSIYFKSTHIQLQYLITCIATFAVDNILPSQVPHLTFGSELGVHYPYRRGIFLFTLQALKIEPEHGW